jgi:predicted dehydrogenase
MGKRGTHHAEAFRKNGRFRLAGLCDVDASRLDAAAKRFGISETSVAAAALVEKIRPDIFCFCTLPGLRLPLIRAGVEAGVKLIAYEKPTALSTQEGLEIMKLVRQSGVKTVVSHQHRYGEHYKKVKAIISSGMIGRVHTVYGHATGWMTHMMTHLLDYMRWYNDYAEAEWVVGQAHGTAKFSDNHPSPDYIGGLIQFANGVRGVVECGDGAPDVPEVEYWWRKCRIGAQGSEGFAEVLTGGGWRAVTRDGLMSGPGCMDYEHDMGPYVEEIAEWLDDENKPHSCDGESGFRDLEIMMAICRSAVQRGKVKLPLGPGETELATLERALGG